MSDLYEQVELDFLQALGMPEAEKTLGVTGRCNLGGNNSYVRKTLRDAILYFHAARGITHVMVGGALGADTLAAQEVIKMKESGFDKIALTLVIPFPDFTSKWPTFHQNEFRRMWGVADYTVCVGSKGYTPLKYHVRNECIVSNSSMMLAVWDGQEKGGTWDTIKIAKQLDVPIYRICPKLKKKGWLTKNE